jgi:geranylgeranyl pyrophosphate synthase/predicted secreted hydrolase
LPDTRNSGVAARWRADWPPRGTEAVPAGYATPHPGCGTECWYFHCQLTTPAGGRHSVFCVFSRDQADDRTGQRLVMHSLRWARVDQADGFHISRSWLDGVDLLRRATAADEAMDAHFRAALVETLSGGEPVGPDRLLPGPVRVGPDTLDLDYGGVGTLRALPDGSYDVSVTDECERFRLTFTPQKPAVSQGHDGVIAGRFPDGSDARFAYLVPRLAVEGTLTPVGGRETPVTGTGWHERSFGGGRYRLDPHRAPDRAGECARIQLDNGWDLSVIRLRHAGTADQLISVACSPDGERVPCTVMVSTTQPWQSVRTLHTYPTGLDVTVPELELRLTIRARPPLAEIESVALGVRGIGPWSVTDGVMRGEPVQGLALVELVPFNRVDDLESLPRRIGPIVGREITTWYPDALTEESAAKIIGADRAFLDVIPLEELEQALIAPVRHLADAGGKHWRAFVVHTLAVMRGAPVQEMLPMFGAAEIMQSAMLAIDDIQDGSLERRGRPAAHVVFGTAETLNAAYAVFFMDQLARTELARSGAPEVSDQMRLRLYQSYLRTVRMLHIGQALDIRGHTEEMDAAVATGDPERLLARIRAVHRFKTSKVFRYLAEDPLWASVAPDASFGGVGEYWDAVGLAFQISDDVLDLRGLVGADAGGRRRRLRRAGEDLRAGKVTMPMAYAVRLLPAEEMAVLWKSVRGGGADDATVCRVAEKLIDCGAVEACYAEARAVVDDAWRLMERVPSSYPKVVHRAIGLYAANRRSGDPA